MTKKPKVLKCTLKRGRITPCDGLSSTIQYYGRGTKYQGVQMHTMVSMKTGDFSRHLVVLKSGEHGKKGVVMNFCPFCRGALLRG